MQRMDFRSDFQRANLSGNLRADAATHAVAVHNHRQTLDESLHRGSFKRLLILGEIPQQRPGEAILFPIGTLPSIDPKNVSAPPTLHFLQANLSGLQCFLSANDTTFRWTNDLERHDPSHQRYARDDRRLSHEVHGFGGAFFAGFMIAAKTCFNRWLSTLQSVSTR